MEQIRITDPDVLACLVAKEEVQVLDPWGRIIGRFSFEKMSFPEFEVTDAELDRERNDPNTKWYTTEEVLAYIRKRAALVDAARNDDAYGSDSRR